MGEDRLNRRALLGRAGAAMAVAPVMAWAATGWSQPGAMAREEAPRDVLFSWYRLVLELVRHTPTYSPPVASRALAYLGVTAFEAQAGLDGPLMTLAGQLNGLTPVPGPDGPLDAAAVLHAALAFGVREFFGNTGSTGQRAMATMQARLGERVAAGLDPEIARSSTTYGEVVGAHILAWSATDGGAVVDNLGFPQSFELQDGPEHWVPTSTIGLQQSPLLPGWGENRTFAMPSGASCLVAPPVAYSEAEGSPFYAEAMAVYDAVARLDSEREAIARFWSDDPMLSPTPPGHWISLALEELEGTEADLPASLDLLARLGIGLADAFIGCWHEKYRHDLVRPVTYIRRVIEPDWQPPLITPPFPEYPSGHSTQSGAAAAVLEAHFGTSHAFIDRTHEADGLAGRSFQGFWAAAEEAAISRVYGGIHYPMAASSGLEQGRCIAAHANALVTRATP